VLTNETWLGIEIRHLAALQAVARERSFRAAARRLGYVPSAVSSQIARLERIVGARLVERSRGMSEVELTPAGAVILQHAAEIVARLDAARADLRQFSEGRTGRVLLGITQGVGAGILPAFLQAAAEEHPGLTLRPVELESDRAFFGLLESADLDLAFVELPTPAGPFETQELLRDDYVLLAPGGRPRRPLSLAELAGTPFVGAERTRGRMRVEEQLRSAGAEPRVVVRADGDATVHALVAAGVGVAIVPELSAPRRDPRIAVLDLADTIALAPRVLALAWHAERVQLLPLRALVTLAQGICTEVSAPVGGLATVG